MGKMDIPYVEKDGILYPLLTIHADMELSAAGKYGLFGYLYEGKSQGKTSDAYKTWMCQPDST